MTTANQEFLIIKQKVEVLAGERGDPRQAAIRMIYLSQLQNLIGKLTKSTNDLQDLVSKINEDVLDIRADVTLVQGDVATIQIQVGDIQGDIIQITGDVAIIQQALSDANANLDNLELDIIQLQSDVNGLSGVTADVDQLQIEFGSGIDLLQSYAVTFEETRAQGFVAFDQLLEAGAQGVFIEFATQAQAAGNVVGAAVRIELPSDPQAVLS